VDTASGRVTTFYSYKGGVGRTMALADVAVQLCLWGYRVLAVDMDLEAPGLDEFFSRWTKRSNKMSGLVELLAAFSESEQDLDWRGTVRRITLPAKSTKSGAVQLSLLSAGRRDETYAHRVQNLDWNDLYDKGVGRALERAREDWVREFDFVLVDSRTGVSDSGGVCTIQLPDYLVTLFTPSNQSIEGARAVALAAQEGQAKLPVDRSRLLVVPIPTRIDQTEYKLREQWQRLIVKRLGDFVTEWAGSRTLTADILRQLAVPYVPYWSYGERLPVLDEGAKEKLGVRFAHETLAALLASELTGALEMVKNREGLVREAQAGPASRRPDRFDVFISYDRAEPKFAAEIARGLQAQGLRVWYDREKLRGGDAWDATLAKAIRDSENIVVLAGKQQNEWQEYELNEAVRSALSSEKRIVPVVPFGVDPDSVPSLLRQFQQIRLGPQRPASAAVAELVKTLQQPVLRTSSGKGGSPLPSASGKRGASSTRQGGSVGTRRRVAHRRKRR
jgi:MinD-like ATPase involved in chromosome partitioning or flagellar assembly